MSFVPGLYVRSMLNSVGLVAEQLVREFAQGMPFDPPYRTRLFEGADRLGQDCRPWQRWL